MLTHDGELQLAFRRIADWRKQRELASDLEGLEALAVQLEAIRQSVLESRLVVLRQRLGADDGR